MASKSSPFRPLLAIVPISLVLGFCWFLWRENSLRSGGEPRTLANRLAPRANRTGKLTVWWDAVPRLVRNASLSSDGFSNIRLKDYVGPEECKGCHREQHDHWSEHAHRWMNAVANDATVKGEFSETASINYLGGTGKFFRKGDDRYMSLQREEINREYLVTQTIGSRFFQYYVGHQLRGPEKAEHPFYETDHVLPFGYWLSQKEWVPVVHIEDEERADGNRADPFSAPPFLDYALECTHCHTTRPIGDWMLRRPDATGQYSPRPLSFFMSGYLADAHPSLVRSGVPASQIATEEIVQITNLMERLDARTHAATLGISCEACHNGCREHVNDPTANLPRFFPSSRHLFVEADPSGEVHGRTDANKNWICSRCHSGARPEFANGISTWNSTEFTDAVQGSCYSQLTCVHCHDPHTAIGKKWQFTPQQDDSRCLQCHQELEPRQPRLEHTHHAADSEGSRCMNCHMPRLNEGLEDVVRTHTIFSPNEPKMIEANQPNACNLCHLDKSIDWTVDHLQKWYGSTFSEDRLAKNYSDRSGPAGIGWLDSAHESTRLVAAAALTRAHSPWALTELIAALDDPYLLNRQFAQIGLEEMLEVKLSQFGYRFYMTPGERRGPISRIRDQFINVGSE